MNRKLFASALIFASLLNAAPRKPDYSAAPPHVHHSHKRLWVTLGILAASSIATGAILASEQHSGKTPQPTATCNDSAGVHSHLCTVTGGLR